MGVLIDTFEDQDLVDDNPYMTHYKVGQRDVVQYLRQLVGFDERKLKVWREKGNG